MTRNRPRHLRDAATLCPESITIPGEGALRCEHDAGHDGKHKHACTHWGRVLGSGPDADAGAGR